MAIKDILKTKLGKPDSFSKKDGLEAKKKQKEAPAKEKKEEKMEEIKKERKPTSPEVYQILKSPHITEKAGSLAEGNQYVFRAFPRANKTKIKKAIEAIYKIDVLSVKIVNVPEKKRRLGSIEGRRPGYKKAIVKIKEGQKIEIMPR